MKIKLLILLLFCAEVAFGQGTRWDLGGPLAGVSTTTPQPAIAGTISNFLIAVPNVRLNWCQYPANSIQGVPCSNAATTYTDLTLTTACSSTQPITLQGSNVCTGTSDAYGNMGVNAPSGTYTYTLTVGSTTYGPFTVTLGGGSSGGFTPGGDLSGNSTSQKVIGIQGNSVPPPTTGYLNWNGSEFVYSTPSGTVPTLALPPSPLANAGASTAPAYAQGITYVTSAMNWSQALTQSVTAGTPSTVTLTPCPVGVDTSSGWGYDVYISDANSEAVAVTGGTCTSGAGSGTIVFTPFSSHSSYTIESASEGIQETWNAACGTSATYYLNRQCNVALPANGPGYTSPPSGGLFNVYQVYGTIFLHANQSTLAGDGVSLNCSGRGPCIQVGSLSSSSNFFLNNTIRGLAFRDSVNFASNASYAGVVITTTAATSGTATITTSTAHGFRVGDIVDIQFTDDPQYWGDHVVTAVPTTSSFSYTKSGTSTVASQTTPGVVALAYEPILDNGNGTKWIDIKNEEVGNYALFNNFFDIWDNENASITNFNSGSTGLNASSTWVGCFVAANGPNSTAPVISIRDSSITAQGANGICDNISNGLFIDNSVIQATSLWQVSASSLNGNFQGTNISNLYSESTLALNPSSSPKTPYGGTGIGGLIAGYSSGAANFSVRGMQGPAGIIPTGGTGSTPYSYFIVVNDTTAGTQTSPMLIMNWESTGSDSPIIKWPRVANAADTITYDVIRMATAAVYGQAYPYNGGCAGGSGGTCGSVATSLSQATACSGGLVCTYTDTGVPNTSSYTVKRGTYIGSLVFWPGSLVTVNKTVYADNELTPAIGVGLSYAPIQTTQFCQNQGVGSAGGYTACLTGQTNEVSDTATIMSDGPPFGEGTPTFSKGRLNIPNFANIIYGHCILTLLDANPYQTAGTVGYRPNAGANDTCIGTDVPLTGGTAPSASGAFFMNPVHINQYIGALPNTGATNWLEQLTATTKTFNVPVNFNAGGNVPSGQTFTILSGGTLTCAAGSTCPTGPFASLTTTGTSGPATLSGGVLNIPQYSGGGGTYQVNGSAITSSSVINFQNSTAFNGLTVTFANPSAGNIQLGLTGSLNNGGLANSSLTVAAGSGLSGGGSVALGGSTTLSALFQSLTTTGTTGAATLSGGVLNIPQYVGSFTNPMTTLGDIIYENAAPAATRLAGTTSAILSVLTQTGTGSASAAPAWGQTVGGGASVVSATVTSLQQGQTLLANSNPSFVNVYPGVNVDPQTGAYTLACPTDRLGEVDFNLSAAATLTVPQAGSTTCFGSNIAFVVRNAASSTAVLTVTATTSTFQPENVSSHTVLPGAGLFVYSDATSSTGNYHALDVPASSGGVNIQTATYTATAADRNKLLVMNCSGACVATLPAAPPNSSWALQGILSIGSTLATVSLNSLNLNGSATAPTLITGHVLKCCNTDGSNYFGDIASANVTASASISNGQLVAGSGGGFGIATASQHNVALTLACADTSGSGTAQVCTTASSLVTPVTGDRIWYTTTTTNSGTGLTVNVNSLGAKSVAIPGSSGWTTTLTANIIPANTPLELTYTGTNWNVTQTGTAASSGGGVTSVNTLTGAVVIEAATSGQMAVSGGASAALTGAADMTYSTHTFSTTANGIFDWSAATGAGAFKLPAVTGGTQLSGTVTANLSSPAVFQNTNSSNNNTSITMGISSPGTSTGQTTLNINGATTGGDLTDWGTGGTWSSGVLSGQTNVAKVGITGGFTGLNFTSNGTTAGFIDYPQGSTSASVAPCNTANSICDQAPTSVTAGVRTLPGTLAQGVLTNTGTSSALTQGYSGDANHSATVSWSTATSISSTSLCSSGNCPVGTYRISAYIDVTTACTTTGSYVVNIIYTDDTTVSKTIVIPLVGLGITTAFGPTALSATLVPTSTTDFGTGSFILRSTGTTSINYSTTAGACATGGPGIGKLYLVAEPIQ